MIIVITTQSQYLSIESQRKAEQDAVQLCALGYIPVNEW